MKISIRAFRHSTRVSELCTQEARGVIHSVFNHAINILVQNELYSILALENGYFPNAIIVKPSKRGGFKNFGIEPNLPVKFNQHCLILGNQLQIDFENSTIFSDKIDFSAEILDAVEIQNNLKVAVAEGEIQARKEGLGVFWEYIAQILSDNPVDITNLPDFQKKALYLQISLIRGLRRRNLELVNTTSSELSGLGIGLTPSGDDLLTGLVAAFRIFGSKTINSSFYSQITDLILMSSTGKTNAIAHQILLSATRQEVMSELASYISAIVSTQTVPLKTATRLLFSYGHSSGTEMGLGAFIGITLVNETRSLLLV